jgi:3-oxoacyl-[acyl-carrier-protein] synthase-1
MATPVGLTATQSCAAIRAGISAVAELDLVIETELFDEVPIMGCAVPPVTQGYQGLGRWTRLAAAALKDLIASARIPARELVRTGLYLALPPLTRAGVDPRLPMLLGGRIAQALKVPDLVAQTRAYADGHAAGARACHDALSDLASGAVDRAIVCGVDSMIEPDTLKFFIARRRLKTDDDANGFIPGEASACFLIERALQAKARGMTALAAIDGTHVAVEPVTVWSDQPCLATGLGEALRAVLYQMPDRGLGIRVVVCDLNGEAYRAKEFGNAAARALAAIAEPWAVWHPADCIGDTGAAAFTVSVCVAVRALHKGYAKGASALVLGSSDDGLRGALSLRQVPVEA